MRGRCRKDNMTPDEKNAATAAAPRPFPLGGRTLLLSPPTPADSAAIMVEGKRLLRGQETPLGELVTDPAFARLPPACQLEATREATRTQLGGTRVNGLDLAFELANPPLLSFAIWLLALEHHPDLTREEIAREINDDNAGEMFVHFVRASGMLELEKKTWAGASG